MGAIEIPFVVIVIITNWRNDRTVKRWQTKKNIVLIRFAVCWMSGVSLRKNVGVHSRNAWNVRKNVGIHSRNAWSVRKNVSIHSRHSLSCQHTSSVTLQIFNKPLPEKYNIFLYHCLTVVLSLPKRSYQDNLHMFFIVLLKLAFSLTVYMFGSGKRTFWHTDSEFRA